MTDNTSTITDVLANLADPVPVLDPTRALADLRRH